MLLVHPDTEYFSAMASRDQILATARTESRPRNPGSKPDDWQKEEITRVVLLALTLAAARAPLCHES